MSLLEIEVADTDGFFLSGVETEQSAAAAFGAGDVNGDGYSDILVGNGPTIANGDASSSNDTGPRTNSIAG